MLFSVLLMLTLRAEKLLKLIEKINGEQLARDENVC
jgi:hypothetical protein